MDYCKNDVPMVEQQTENEEKGHRKLQSIVKSEVSDFKEEADRVREGSELERIRKKVGVGPQLRKVQSKPKKGLPGFMVAKKKDADKTDRDESGASEEPDPKRSKSESVSQPSETSKEPNVLNSSSSVQVGLLGGYG